MILFPGCKCCGGGGWACYECTPCLVVAFETAGTDNPANNSFHLGPYLTGHTAHAGRPYRFVEVGADCAGNSPPDDTDGLYTYHGAGYITPDGVIGDPWVDYDPATGVYTSSYPYRGYLRLQIGCDSPEGGDEYTAIYSDDCTDGDCSSAACGEYTFDIFNIESWVCGGDTNGVWAFVGDLGDTYGSSTVPDWAKAVSNQWHYVPRIADNSEPARFELTLDLDDPATPGATFRIAVVYRAGYTGPTCPSYIPSIVVQWDFVQPYGFNARYSPVSNSSVRKIPANPQTEFFCNGFSFAMEPWQEASYPNGRIQHTPPT